ncbi:MAG TPA: DUF4105 domain-containing protein [Candidatus Binatia bacterium]|nr:DUF4105 domain-containing protein [Candidatus Binatia bacterium]
MASGEKFFVSEAGPTSPRDELNATLAAFFDPTRAVREGEPPQCTFRARYAWLVRELSIDPTRLPPATCESYDTWRKGLDAHGLSLIFPEAYMNNPASMFGHTLLRVDSGEPGGDEDLLAYAINFAAESGGDGGMAFAFKGIFGGYAGYFSVLPYYDKLKQYGDWENRDIWEYPLDLTAAEVDFLLAHVWELRGVPFQYFFFDDNCAYQLLALLDIARPELELRREFPLWAIPIDTVRVTASETDLISTASWRPSPATLIRYRSARLPASSRTLARDLALGRAPTDDERLEALSDEERGAVLSLAYTYLRYLYIADEVPRELSAPRSRQLLAALSRVDAAVAPPDPPQPSVRPDVGHPIARLGFGGGVRDGDGFVELSLRPVFHALSDPRDGYAAGANLEIGRTALRYEPERGRLRVEEVVLVDLTSLTPRDAFLRPISWSFDTGWRTRMLSDGSGDGVDAHGVAYLRGGAGLVYALTDHSLAYGLARAAVEAADALDEKYAVAPGAEIGVLADWLDDRLRTRARVEGWSYLAGDTTTAGRAGAEATLSLSDRAAVVVDVAVEHAYGETWVDAKLSWRSYFRKAWGDR